MTGEDTVGKVYNKILELIEESKIDSWDVISLLEYIKHQVLNQVMDATKKK